MPYREGAKGLIARPEIQKQAVGVHNTADVLIVGAGPAGLSAALELKKLGIKNVVIAERESEAGGIPRMCGHIGFGLRDLYRVMTGPNYAQKYRELAERAEINIHTNTTITGWDIPLTLTPNASSLREERVTLSFTSPT